jgi:HAD superfamily 5'-nucleotidase-like hydrolase
LSDDTLEKRENSVKKKVYVNRTLNLKRIKYIGLDMDHTLIRYNSEAFESLSYSIMLNKLIKRGYPEVIKNLEFSFEHAIRGLVIDRKKGNLLKVSRHCAIRASYHGNHPIDFKTQQRTYKSTYIDLSEKDYMPVDTSFSLSLAILYAQLVDIKNVHPELKFPDFVIMADDVLDALDEAHRDGSLKDVVKKDLGRFVIKDSAVVHGLEKHVKHGKKIFVLTNSDFHYTKLLLDYAINPFLKDHKSWENLFDIVITFAQKPKFFYGDNRYLQIDPKTGLMSNFDSKLTTGIYQGGSATKFTEDLGLQGDEILYVGDHIYGDILRLKKDCNWRTAMVIEELDNEMRCNQLALPINNEIEQLMRKKEPFEDELTDIMTDKIESGTKVDEGRINDLQKVISDIDGQISMLIKKQQALYNPYWGQLMRAGNEESYFAHQVDRYACVYMTKLGDLLELSPRSYFRAPRRFLAHEIIE